MVQRAGLVILALLVLLAGCSGLDTDPSSTTTSIDEPTETPPPPTESPQTVSPTPTSAPHTATQTAPPTPTVDPDNPFGKEELTVAFDGSASDRGLRPRIQAALEYWEEHSTEYVDYPIRFRLAGNADSVDIEIQLERPPIACAGRIDNGTIGCAPVNDDSAPPTTHISISTNYTGPGTTEIAIHELGHALGLSHGDEPSKYMRAIYPSPLHKDRIRVFMLEDGGDPSRFVEDEMKSALDYFSEHESLNESQEFTWVRVDSKENANLVLVSKDQGQTCFENGDGSCYIEGDYRDQGYIVVEGIRDAAVGWHIASLLAPSRFPEGEIPEDLTSEADYFTRNGGWRD